MDSHSRPSFADDANPLLTYHPSACSTDRLAPNIRLDFAGWSPSTRAKNKIRKRQPSYLCRIDLGALAAIFFAILALLMCGTPSHYDLPENAVDLFRATDARPFPQAAREDALQVYISHDGTVYFASRKVNLEKLSGLFTTGIQNGSERRVYLLVDERAAYGDVRPVLQAVHDAGIKNVSFWAWENYMTR